MEPAFSAKPKLDRSSVPVILWNLVPFAGVLFLGWKGISVFMYYALETVIIGLFNILKLIAVYYYGQPARSDESGVSGLGIIPFFIAHYYFFVFIQLSIFFSSISFGASGGGPLSFIHNFIALLNQPSGYIALTAFFVNCAFSFVNDFILTGTYTRRSMGEQMFEPYPRIFVQQFVVILGSFAFMVSGSGIPVLVIFVAIKIYFDLILRGLDIATIARMQKTKVDNQA